MPDVVRIVGLLGTGPYQEVTHRFPGCDSQRQPTPFSILAAALDARQRFPESFVSVVVVATRDALDICEVPLSSATRGALRENWRFATVRVDDGRDFAEQQGFFERLTACLDHQALPAAGRTPPEPDRPREIVLDVTHGYRAQSVLAGGVAAFVRSEWRRTEVPDPPPLRIVYAAPPPEEAQRTDVVDVWDLSDLLLLADWNSALDALRRFGRADDLGLLVKTDGIPRRRPTDEEKARVDYAGRLARVSRSFADDLALNRWLHIVTKSAREFRATLLDAKAREAFVARRPLLGEILNQTASMADGLDAETLLGEDGLGVMPALARLYRRLQRYSELAAVLREGATTAYALAAGLPHREPDTQGCTEDRKRADMALNAAVHALRISLPVGGRPTSPPPPPPPEPDRADAAARLGSRIEDPRNQVLHGGIRDKVLDAATLREQLEKMVPERGSPITGASASEG